MSLLRQSSRNITTGLCRYEGRLVASKVYYAYDFPSNSVKQVPGCGVRPCCCWHREMYLYLMQYHQFPNVLILV
jgi:hypothetical protein